MSFVKVNGKNLHQDIIDLLDKKIPAGYWQDEDIHIPARIVRVCEVLESLKIREDGGNNKGEMIGKIQAIIGPYNPKGDGQAWCLSLVQVVVAYIELKTGLSSQVFPTEGCVACFDGSRKISVNKPQVGDIFIWKKVGSWQGHAGIILEVLESGMMITYEGNTGSDDRDGEGAHVRTRKLSGAGNLKHYGFLRPFKGIE